ncbi:heme ABC transporter substrate-binding protein IsdE [Oscillibacter valericigenes]|nr:heme ABC transporter substrate-binding protein IsdE [Oscillibacter valericigenes]
MHIWRKTIALAFSTVLALSLSSCVNQHPAAPISAAEETRIIATSNATLKICDKLGLDLVAIPTTIGTVPERYQGLPEIGTAMAPDAEQIALLQPTDVIGPDTLAESIEPTYQAAGVPYTWIDLQSVKGMYDSIAMLGEKYGKHSEAQTLISQYEETLAEFHRAIKGVEAPRVLMLMGLPGAYIACTPNSYAGSLIDLAGAENVVQVDDEMNFVSWNTEELLALDPDVILLTAHGLPEQAMEMFSKEFSTNDIWKHFRAVQERQVYQLDYQIFGMSCTFDWPKALETLKEIIYDKTVEPYDAETAYAENKSGT